MGWFRRWIWWAGKNYGENWFLIESQWDSNSCAEKIPMRIWWLFLRRIFDYISCDRHCRQICLFLLSFDHQANLFMGLKIMHMCCMEIEYCWLLLTCWCVTCDTPSIKQHPKFHLTSFFLLYLHVLHCGWSFVVVERVRAAVFLCLYECMPVSLVSLNTSFFSLSRHQHNNRRERNSYSTSVSNFLICCLNVYYKYNISGCKNVLKQPFTWNSIVTFVKCEWNKTIVTEM